VYIVANAVHPD